jgi:hypothetical protein
MGPEVAVDTLPRVTEPLSILVVAARPDQRRSTEVLRLLVGYLDRHPDTRVQVWFLRADTDGGDDEPWPGSRVVDELRTWWPTRPMVGETGRRLADALRGARLRWWLRQARPDVVLLDDGLGDRVLDPWTRPVLRLVRRNPEPPLGADMEPPALESADAIVELRPTEHDDGMAHLVLPVLRRRSLALQMADPAERRRIRDTLRIGGGEQLVVGWGEDAWIDGADLFIRTLWALGDRYGVRPHALWLGLSSDPHEADRIRTEAARCGLADRFHLRPLTEEIQRYVGDAVLLPTRVPEEDPERILNALCIGQVVVATEDERLPDQAAPMPPLDVEAAAVALRDGLAGDRAERFERSRLLDIDQWLDHDGWVGRVARLAGR